MQTRRGFGALALASGLFAGTAARAAAPPLPAQAQTRVGELLAGRNAPGGFVAVSVDRAEA